MKMSNWIDREAAEKLLGGSPDDFKAAVRKLGVFGMMAIAESYGLKTNCKSITRIIGDVARKLHGKRGNEYLAAVFDPIPAKEAAVSKQRKEKQP